MTKRNFILKILLVCCALCTSLALSLSLFKVKASAADSELPSVQTIAMMSGAQVRKESGTAGSQTDLQQAKGIRFRLYINQSYFESVDEVGVYVALASEATAEDMKAETTADENAKWLFTATDTNELVALEAGEETQEAVYVLNAVVANPPEANYNTQLIANGYAEVNGEKTFAAEPQQRSVAQVASLALLDGEGVTEGDGADDPHGTLNHYVNTVATAEGFDFANTAITTDKYKTANPDVGAELPENLKAKWESSNEAVATVDGEGVITRVGEGETTITAILGTTTKSATVTIGAPQLFKATEDTVASVGDGGVTVGNFVDTNFDTADGLVAYTGEAATYTYSSGTINYSLTLDYTVEAINQIVEDYGYTHVDMWMAYDFDETSGYICSGGTTLHRKANGTWSSLNAAGKVEWNKYTVSIADLLSCIVNAEVRILTISPSTASEAGVSTVRVYFGDITFRTVDLTSALYKVYDTKSAASIVRGEFKGEYVEGGSLDFEENGYTGDAAKMLISSSDYYLTPAYTTTQIDELVNTHGYTNVSMWIAYDVVYTTNNTSYLSEWQNYSQHTFYYNTDDHKVLNWGNSTVKNKYWYKHAMTIDEYKTLFADKTQISLLKGSLGAGVTSDSSYIYFGDIIFE